MTPVHLAIVLAAAALGGVTARLLTPLVLTRAPKALMRTNVEGHEVPAVLGLPLLVAGLVPIAAWIGVKLGVERGLAPIALTTALTLVALSLAGRWDDTKGHELARGFKGHIGAARSGRLTGGLVKLLVGGIVGLLTGIVLRDGTSALQTFLLVPLTANLINLTDRAPGRAGKVALLVGLPLLAFGHAGWAVAAAGVFSALAYLLMIDLAEVGMLGDMGANAVGGVVGLGLALSVPPGPRWFVIAALVLLNALSEKYSFSIAIAGSPSLNRLDRLGRRTDRENANTSEP